MTTKELIEFESKFRWLVNFKNQNDTIVKSCSKSTEERELCCGKMYSENMDFISERIRRYCRENGIETSIGFNEAYIYVIYEDESKKQQIYQVYSTPLYHGKLFEKQDNLENGNYPIVNFKDVIKYYHDKNTGKKLKELKNIILNLKKQGFSSTEIQSYIENILSNEKKSVAMVNRKNS